MAVRQLSFLPHSSFILPPLDQSSCTSPNGVRGKKTLAIAPKVFRVDASLGSLRVFLNHAEQQVVGI
ncbi:unnamed protein product [Soboliphyme baturini]|uniref:Uncharacterized protein n=1 Tax=Soboliphyme baturini TaxID=241478 RepID=A0A183IYM3_9BILA|nr:unnamed protein product [Soboliphyme baturini]